MLVYNTQKLIKITEENKKGLTRLTKKHNKPFQDIINQILLIYLKEKYPLSPIDMTQLTKRQNFKTTKEILKELKKEAVIKNISVSLLITIILNSYLLYIEEE